MLEKLINKIKTKKTGIKNVGEMKKEQAVLNEEQKRKMSQLFNDALNGRRTKETFENVNIFEFENYENMSEDEFEEIKNKILSPNPEGEYISHD